MISDEAKKEIDIWVAKYPQGKQSSAVMQALTLFKMKKILVEYRIGILVLKKPRASI